MVRNTRNVAKIKKRCDPYLKKMSNKNCNDFLGAENNDSASKNGLSLNFTIPNIKSAAIPIPKTMVVYAWVHLPF